MILIATCSEYPHPTPSLEALVNALRSTGMDADYLPWKTTPLESFAAADAVLPLCCWDYYDNPAAFLRWIEALDAAGGTLINAPETLRWNFRKTYLIELANAGLAAPKTFYLPRANRLVVEELMAQEGWSVAVLKPVSSQSGHGVRKLNWAEWDGWDASQLAGEMLLQEFQPDIGALGETTMTFIEGVFSHAVRRVLKPGEWRANAQFGITYEQAEVSADVTEKASAYIKQLPRTPLYARVDGLVRPDGFMLMELELIDPYLYLEFAPGSAERMARAIIERVKVTQAA